MQCRLLCTAFIAAIVSLPTGPVSAQNALRDGSLDTALLSSDAFLAGHPDMRYRKTAEEAYQRGDYSRAIKFFERSARYADKLSQGRMAEMLWAGEGISRDRALAYAWMDVAGERGYRVILAIRERYWSELTQAERERALAEGQAIYAEYGDDVAKPRLERAIVKARRSMTGSRTGTQTGNLDVTSVARGRPNIADAMRDGTTFRGERFYDKTYWQPDLYWAWQAKIFNGVPEGTVEIGEIRVDPDLVVEPEPPGE